MNNEKNRTRALKTKRAMLERMHAARSTALFEKFRFAVLSTILVGNTRDGNPEDVSQNSTTEQPSSMISSSSSCPKNAAERERKIEDEAMQMFQIVKDMYCNRSPRDEFTLFGEQVAIKMRHIRTTSARIIAQHLINTVLFEAQIGKYNPPPIFYPSETSQYTSSQNANSQQHSSGYFSSNASETASTIQGVHSPYAYTSGTQQVAQNISLPGPSHSSYENTSSASFCCTSPVSYAPNTQSTTHANNT